MKITICCETQQLAEEIEDAVNTFFFSIQKIDLLSLSKKELREELCKKSYDCDVLIMQIQSEDASDTIRLLCDVRQCFPMYKLISISSRQEENNYYPELFELNLLYYIRQEKMNVLLPRALRMAVNQFNILIENCLLCKSNHQFLKIPFDRIMYIEREMHTTKVYTRENCYMLRRKLNELEGVLAKYPALMRCHMSFFVNYNYIISFGHKKFEMKNGESIPVSRKYYQNVKTFIEEQYKGVD